MPARTEAARLARNEGRAGGDGSDSVPARPRLGFLHRRGFLRRSGALGGACRRRALPRRLSSDRGDLGPRERQEGPRSIEHRGCGFGRPFDERRIHQTARKAAPVEEKPQNARPSPEGVRGSLVARERRLTAQLRAAVCNGRSTSTPAVCGATMRRCRRAAGCRPRLLAIAPFKSERARAIGARMSAFSGCSTACVKGAQGDASLTPVQAPKTASLLVSRQWPWTCAVATSSTS